MVSVEVTGGENVPGIPGVCSTRNFTYLVRGPFLGSMLVCSGARAASYRHRWWHGHNNKRASWIMLLNSIIQDALLLCQLRRLSSSVPVDLSVWCVVCTGSELQRLEYMAGYQDIGIDHDTVCAGVGGTAIRHSTSCAGRRAAACGRAGRHNECCAWWQYHPRQRRPYKWSISILPRSQFYKKQGKLAFSTSCTAVRPHRRLRNDAWRRDS